MNKSAKVLFITTKNIDYIRNVQEINLLKENNDKVEYVYSKRKKNILRILSVNLKLLFKNIRKYDKIVIGFLPQFILPFFYKRAKNKEIIIDLFVGVHDTIVNDRKKIKENTKIAKFLKKVDTDTARRANKIIVDTIQDAKYFEKELQISGDKIKILYLEADKSIYNTDVEPCEDNRFEKKFVVLYFGTMIPLQGVNVILDAAKMLENEENISFCIIGNINKQVRKKYKNVVFIKWLEQEVLAKYIARADLCLAGHFSDDIDKAKRTISGKAYIYDEMEKIMILGDNEANKERFTKENKNYHFVKMGDPKSLKNKILEIYNCNKNIKNYKEEI